MQAYDWIMLAVLAAAVLFGAWKGLAWQVASLAAIFVSYFLALRFRGVVAPWIQVDPPWNQFIAMFAIYLAASLAIWVGFGFIRSFIDRFHLRSFDRQAGALLGAVKGGALCVILTLFAVTLLSAPRREGIVATRSGKLIARAITHLRAIMPKEVHSLLDPYLNQFDQALQSSPSEASAQSSPGGWLNEPAADGIREFIGRVVTTGGTSLNEGVEGTLRQVLRGGENSSSGVPPASSWNRAP